MKVTTNLILHKIIKQRPQLSCVSLSQPTQLKAIFANCNSLGLSVRLGSICNKILSLHKNPYEIKYKGSNIAKSRMVQVLMKNFPTKS